MIWLIPILLLLIILCFLQPKIFFVFFIPFVLCYACQAGLADAGHLPDDVSSRVFFSVVFSFVAAMPILGILIAIGADKD